MKDENNDLKSILTKKEQGKSINELQPQKQLRPSEWVEIRLFLSSTFIDTHSERNLLVKKIIPDLNRQLKDSCITIVPVDLRWGVFGERSKDCYAIQKTCLNEIDNCRQSKKTYPYFIGIRTNRYGWIQDELLDRNGYENPELFDWVQILKEHKKELAITSLECIHAVSAMEEMPPAPTVFFYEREITNEDKIEDKYRWIYDMEHQEEDLGRQYTQTPKAGIYAEDKEELNEYLKSLDFVRYSKYKCMYKEGGAKITGNDGKKDFGVGYVEDLDDFENIVKKDLLKAIQKNFKAADLSDIPPIKLRNLPYEAAMKEKALTFVKRVDLTHKIIDHCTTSTAPKSLMILKGKPGHGKSALMAYAADKCINNMRSENTFVFAHGVDTCPQSSDLEQMLLRLHDNLCVHVGIENTLKTSEDLKNEHVSQLEEIARNNPEQRFVIFVDAVNQLHDSMQAHSMWWLPNEETSHNLRLVISTLPDESNTFANAKKQCPNAEVVNVEEMTQEEGKKMVSNTLKHYNKKLTTDDSDCFLGNQMQLLLDKNCTPLYLSAACEALRTLGVYEELTKEIEKFPATVQELFSYLLDRWSYEYGEKFICYLMCVINLSRDGLHENMISDILRYIKNKMSIKFKFTLSNVFSSIRGFLASGGGGNLRFFHDQLNQVVRERYLNPSHEFLREINEMLAGFYLEEIKSQLCEKPLAPPSLYHSDCLHHVVYHQTLAMKNDEQSEQFEQTLRNIFFVREKIKQDQLTKLMKEYLFSLQYATDETTKNSLQIWKKFVVIYAPLIKELPQWSYNMAMNQVTSSYVYSDTKKLDVQVDQEMFPAYWINKPSSEQDDHVLLKYTSRSCGICATTTLGDIMVAVGLIDPGKQVSVFDMKTCELLAQFHMEHVIRSMTFSTDNMLWIGDQGGIVHICDVTTDRVEWSSERIGEEEGDRVVWLQNVDHNVICGTCKGTVASISTTTRSITNTWKTGEEWTHVYHYHHTSKILYTGHNFSVKCWKLDGVMVKSLRVEGSVLGLDVHPTKENVMACNVTGRVVQLNILSGEVMWEVKGKGKHYNCRDVVYTCRGGRMVCVVEDLQTLTLLDGEGNITNKVKGHSSYIETFRLVPGTPHLVTAGDDGSYLFNLPKTSERQNEKNDAQYKVISCAGTNRRNEIILLKRNKKGKCVIERCHGDSLETLASVDVKGGSKTKGVVPHPTNDNLVVVHTIKTLLFLDTESLETVAKHSVICEDESNYIVDFTICKNGTKCVVAKYFSGTSVVYDITNINVITKLTTFKIDGTISSSDINSDGTRVVCGEKGMVLYDVTTSQPIKTLREKRTQFVRFVDQPEGVMFIDDDHKLHLMSLDGVVIHSFPGKHHYRSLTLLNTSYLVTGNYDDNSIQVLDITTQQIVYKFYHPLSEGFRRFAYQPEHNKLFAVNWNGILYVLK